MHTYVCTRTHTHTQSYIEKYYLINFIIIIRFDLSEMDKLHDFIMNMNILSENHVDIIRWQVDNIKIMLPFFFYYPASPQFQ